MSSVSGISSSLASSLQEQLTAAAASNNTRDVKKLAALYQQTQSQNYLTDLADSLAGSDQAASETLQAMSKLVNNTQDSFQKAIENAPATGQGADITQTLYPVTQKTTVSDLTGAPTAASQEAAQDAKAAQAGNTDADTAAAPPTVSPAPTTPDSYDFVQSLYQDTTPTVSGTEKQFNVTV